MKYDQLTQDYWQNQVSRVADLVNRIVGRGNAVTGGRVVPDDDTLVIGQGRRLPLAVMFIDICAFSKRPSGTAVEQETLLRVINLFFTEMVRIAEEYGGTVEKNTGDGLMAYFEDDAGTPPAGGCMRAISAALSMLYVNTHAIGPILRSASIQELQFRVGIDYGWVTVARVGAAKRFNSLVAVGAPANIACKILAVADPAEIILGEAAIGQLSPFRQQFCVFKTANTGWIYPQTGRPYPFYSYNGRWTQPL